MIIDINVYYGDKKTKNFINFEDFLNHSQTNHRCVKRLRISYDITMFSNCNTKPESYKLIFDFKSGYAYHKTDQENMPPFFIIKDFLAPEFEIEFCDYVVAQNFINHIEKCFTFKDIDKRKGRIFKIIQSNSHLIPLVMQSVFIILSSYLMHNLVTQYTINSNALSQFFIISGTIAFIGYNITRVMGRNIEKRVDMIHDLSTLDFTPGDKDLNEEYKNKSKINKWWSAILFLFTTIVQTIVSLRIENFLD